ncbi:hypothetical protein NM688_g4738 [Phlebia brevispora]|uniref:Uncharacterized protein n=1 Tax=Phlebia brevispora TaxID=194682 RepID=A0ACC1T268_9APHY|nr:hypothetical protein NM688_g4738 [Phlebia brevispora]
MTDASETSTTKTAKKPNVMSGWGDATWGDSGETSKGKTKATSSWGQSSTDQDMDASSTAGKDNGGTSKANATSWGSTTWGAVDTSSGSCWGSTTGNDDGGWSSFAASPKAEVSTSAWRAPPADSTTGSSWTTSPATTRGDAGKSSLEGEAGGWSGFSAPPEPSRDKGIVLEKAGASVSDRDGWTRRAPDDLEEAPSVPGADSNKVTSAGNEDDLSGVLPFGTSTAALIDDADWPMHGEDSTPQKTRANATARARTPSGSYSRASSPCDSVAPDKMASHKDYVKAFARAIRYYNEYEEAKDKLASVKRMESSATYKRIGDRGAQMLKVAKKDAEHRARSAQRRFEDAIEKVDRLSSVTHAPSIISMQEDIQHIHAYTKDVAKWLEEVRPTVESKRAAQGSGDVHMGDDALTARSTSHTCTRFDTRADGLAELRKKTRKLEERLGGLEQYHEDLKKGQLDMIEGRIHEVFTVKRFKPERLHLVPNAEDLCDRCDTHSKVLQGMDADRREIQKEVQDLRKNQPQLDLELQRLRRENDDLRQFQTRLEETNDALSQQSSNISRELDSLRRQFEAITQSNNPPPPPPIGPEVIGESLKPFIMDAIREDVMQTISGMKEEMERTLIKQQEELCNVVWVQLQPTLRIADAIQYTADKAVFSDIFASDTFQPVVSSG